MVKVAIPYKCPICEGKGIVPAGFYTGQCCVRLLHSTKQEKCKSCDGEGIILSECNLSISEIIHGEISIEELDARINKKSNIDKNKYRGTKMSIKQILMDRDGMTASEADKAIKEAVDKMHNYLKEGNTEAAYNICAEEFGLEPDYLMELI